MALDVLYTYSMSEPLLPPSFMLHPHGLTSSPVPA